MTTFSTAKTGVRWQSALCRIRSLTLRPVGCTVLILTLCLPCFGQSSMERRLWALAEVETGSNDHSTGNAGEISRYQILPSVWRQTTKLPISASSNALTAKNVAQSVLERRIACFERSHNRIPTDYEAALLWHCPGAIRHPNREQADFAQRFANLCGITKKTGPVKNSIKSM